MVDFVALNKGGFGDYSLRDLGVLQAVRDDQGTVRGLAELLGLNKPNITRAADKLSERGLLTRKVDQRDRRSVLLAITADGKKLLAKILKAAAADA